MPAGRHGTSGSRRRDAGAAPRPARAALGGAAPLLAVLLALAPGPAAAASNALSAPGVTPTTGTTSTDFVLRVSYDSPQGFPATRVVALLAGKTVTMALASGTATHGTFEAATRLPAGRWTVTFVASASQGKSPTITGPTVIVASPATVTPRPPPSPTPAPRATLAPAPPATTAPPPGGTVTTAPVPTAAASGTPPASAAATDPLVGDAGPVPGVIVGRPGGAVVPAGADGEVEDGALPLLPGLVIAAGLAGAWWWLVGARRRRPHDGPASAVPLPPMPPPARPAAPRRLAEWELAALDDEPIGTVETYRHRL